MEAVDLPMGYPSGTVATKAANAFFLKMKPKELKEVKVLYIHAHGPGILQQAVGPLHHQHRGDDLGRLERDVGHLVDGDSGGDLDEEGGHLRQRKEASGRLAHEAGELRLQTVQEGVSSKLDGHL